MELITMIFGNIYFWPEILRYSYTGFLPLSLVFPHVIFHKFTVNKMTLKNCDSVMKCYKYFMKFLIEQIS